MTFKDLRVSSSFHPEVPLLPDDLSEDYDEDPYFADFDDSSRRLPIFHDKDPDEEVKEGDQDLPPPTNIALAPKEEQNFFGLDHLKQPNGEMPMAVEAPVVQP
jgi:hypothetical protein